MIEILISTGINVKENVLVIYDKNICYYNDHKYIISDEFKKNLVRIIRLWKNEYGTSNNIDDEEFRVTVTTLDAKESFHGKGIFPENYNSLIRIIGDINGNSR